MPDHAYFENLIWKIADLLRGPYRPPQYERVMLPMVVLRRFDCILGPTKEKVRKEYDRWRGKLTGAALDEKLNRAAGQNFHNRSGLDFERLKGDPAHIEKHLGAYLRGFSENARRIFEFFEFENEIEKMREADVLYLVVMGFADVDLHPASVPNAQMGLMFENLVRRFNELANETAGDHFTPRDVIRLMVHVLFQDDDGLLATAGTVATLFDPACGTGGMLAEAQAYLREHHVAAKLYVYGQDYNKRAYATAASDMLIKEVDHNGGGDNIRFGDSFTDDQFEGRRFNYLLTNPPFGVDWKKQRRPIEAEHDKLGAAGRFGAGLPRVNDGALLFLQHMLSKFEPVLPAQHKFGSRLAVVFSGSPLFTGRAGEGESEIRKWVIENDWLEGIIALPEQMFYNTGIGTYIWILTNRKEPRRKGKIQLLDARDLWTPGGSPENKRSLGDKRRHLAPAQIAAVARLYGDFAPTERCKIFANADFGYTQVTVERPLRLNFQAAPARLAAARLRPEIAALLATFDPAAVDKSRRAFERRLAAAAQRRGVKLSAADRKAAVAACSERDETAEICHDAAGRPEPDLELRDIETVPLSEDVDAYFAREVRPYVADAWMDRAKDKIGYEINFNRHFYQYTPPRPLAAIDADLQAVEAEIARLLREAMP